ncbi:hypothetical protein QJS10_CPA07g01108 [Acorus calamus]|uniref:ATPase AAA-type core domain-containing protein n=1 Tax=Acorus calamus TaxID=4465 RepID=A0AAV9EEP0_ACOCL|nr:hypothetical protein QJS10_CPA07g01108 [Acorus calamus]
MLGRHRGRVWLMGHVASYETYMKFLSRFPSVNKDWDLQLLPITSLRLHSLTEPFVPSGGFSETASEMKSSLISRFSTHHSLFRCFLCNEKYEEEASALLKGYTSIANQNYISYPSHIQGVEAINTCNGLDVEKVKEDAAILNAKVLSLQKKWNDICLHFHRSPTLVAGAYQVGVEVSPHIVCLPFFMDKGRICDQMNRNGNTSPNQNGRGIVYSSTVDLQRNSSDRDLSFPVELSKNEQIQTNVKSHSPPLSAASMPDDHASQCSLASVSTDLVLGNVPASCLKAEQKLNVACGNISMALNQSFCTAAYSKSVVVNTHLPTSAHMNLNGTGAPVYQQVPGYADMFGKFDPSDFKELCRSLMGKVGRQDEAVCTISQTVVRCRTGKERCLGASMRGVIWFGFLGPDRVGKRRIATALAELIFGSKYNFICVDLNLQEGLAPPNKIFGCQGMNGYDVKFRGKTIVDYIASEISRQPLSVVFLENVDKADLLVQNSLYQAIKTGKISDSYGREVSINNAMFITAAREIKSKASLTRTECVNFSEERILEAEEWQMQILVGSSSETRCSSANVIITSKTDFINGQGSISSSFSNKRKLNSASLDMFKRAHVSANICLDLNLPVEELEVNDADFSNDDNGFWLKEFFDLVDETVIFSPFDFDAIANKILMQISELFQSDFGSQALLEIDSKVMDHILAATWLSDDTEAPDKWVKQVLGSSFSDARQRYDISTNTVMKLVHSEDTFMEEQAMGIHVFQQ